MLSRDVIPYSVGEKLWKAITWLDPSYSSGFGSYTCDRDALHRSFRVGVLVRIGQLKYFDEPYILHNL